MGALGWLAEYIMNSWKEAENKPIEVTKHNSVEEYLADVPGMTKEEVKQGMQVFNEGGREDPSVDGAKVEKVITNGDEPEAIENWVRSVSVEPVKVMDAEFDRAREIKEQEAAKERQRNNLMNMALLDTTSFTAANDVMQDDYDSWHNKGLANQNIEVIGMTSMNEGDLHIRIEENPSIKWDISVQSIQQSKNVLEAAVQGYKDWQSWLKNHEEQADLEMAKRHLQMFGRIDPTNPDYDRQLQEEVAFWKQAKDDVMGFSGGIKVIQGVNKIANAVKGLGKAETELHHIATDKSKKFDFKNHPAFEETGIDVGKDVDNLVELAGHRGRHTNAYHQEVQRRLDAVYDRFGGTDKLESAVRNELNNMRQELLDGTLNPYSK